MKTIIASLIVAAATLAPLTSVQAAPVGNTAQFAKKTFGGFAAGKKFTLKVTSVTANSVSVTGGVKKIAVPSSLPKFKKNQNVKFTIGSKGELKGNGFSIPFKTGSPTTNGYVVPPTSKKPKGDIGLVFKSGTVAKGASLTFFKTTGSALSTKVITVIYILE